MRTLSVAHAEADHRFASSLAEFLEFGCDITCHADDPGDDLIARAEEGMSSDVVVLLLSPASCRARWQRERWEPVLFDQARQTGVEVVSMLLADCPFPALLRRRNFFDATAEPRTAMRQLKRWLWNRDQPPTISADLEQLYVRLADSAGTVATSGAEASRFVREAAHDFEAILWVPCRKRTHAQIAGELGVQLGLTLERTAKENWQKLRDFLSARRCLVVLDGPDGTAAGQLQLEGRTSTLITTDAVKLLETPETHAYARNLVVAGRYAEAYELLYRLLDAWVDTEAAARELSWICERWDRVGEANQLRIQYGTRQGEQLALF